MLSGRSFQAVPSKGARRSSVMWRLIAKLSFAVTLASWMQAVEVQAQSLRSNPPAPTVIAKNLVTDFGAKCDGVADDAPAFGAFNKWAVASQGNAQVQLTLPSGAACTFLSTRSVFWAKGIKDLLVIGYGARIVNPSTTQQRFFLGGRGLVQDNAHSARTATVTAGSSCITLLNPSKSALFAAGNYALMTGFDLQGLWQAPYGFPPNPHFLEYVRISSVNAGNSVVCFDAPLKNTYKSTWPNYNSGSRFEIDNGGPATLYHLDPSWDVQIEYRGLTIVNDKFQTYANGRSVTYRDVTFTGANCGIPTQNLVWRAINTNMAGCIMEADKLVGEIVLDGVAIYQINFQSSSIDLLSVRNSNITKRLDGTPKRTIISDSTIADLRVGAYAYGRSDEIVCTNCVLHAVSGLGVTEKGPADIGVNVAYSMSGGVISYPNGATITGASDNGWGKVRLTVTSTAGFATGQTVHVSGIVGTAEANGGNRLIAVVDESHLDLPQIAFARPYVRGGVIGNPAPRWAVPGTNLIWAGRQQNMGAFRVVDVTQDANRTYIHTTLSGGFPPVPSYSGKLFIRVHPAPRFTCTNCTGSADAVDLSQAPAGAPIYSYSKRTYHANAPSTTPAAKPTVWGRLSRLTFNVTTPYAGAGSLAFSLSQHNNWPTIKSDYSQFSYGPFVNMKAAGPRIVTPTGVTGAQTGDGGLAVPEAIWFTGSSNSGPTFSANVSGAPPPPTVTVEIVTDQGIK